MGLLWAFQVRMRRKGLGEKSGKSRSANTASKIVAMTIKKSFQADFLPVFISKHPTA
jgi:hypothetical protein